MVKARISRTLQYYEYAVSCSTRTGRSAGTWIGPDSETYEQKTLRLAYMIDTDPELKAEWEERAAAIRAAEVGPSDRLVFGLHR